MMNVFVLCTGRCGSHTFVRASEHITNFSAGHESRYARLGADRIDYPEQHIEADMRLSWFLGELHEKYGNDAYYVHLKRNPEEVARSYEKRWDGIGYIAPVYRDTIVGDYTADRLESSRALVETMLANIRLFLQDKRNVMNIDLETAKAQFSDFWNWIGAEGDYEAAASEWDVRHSASRPAGVRAVRSIKGRLGKVYRAALPR